MPACGRTRSTPHAIALARALQETASAGQVCSDAALEVAVHRPADLVHSFLLGMQSYCRFCQLATGPCLLKVVIPF